MTTPGSPGGWCCSGRGQNHPRTLRTPCFFTQALLSPPWGLARPLRGQVTVPMIHAEGSPARCPFLLAGEGLALAG